MRMDGPVETATPAQKQQADIAGIPHDRPGLFAEYPKMIYKPGKGNTRHELLGGKDGPLPIGNGPVSDDGHSLGEGFFCQTAFVDSVEDEAKALADGWFLSPDPAEQALAAKKAEADAAKDREIAELKAEVAKSKGVAKPATSE